jgi:hypothetical protein
VYLMGVHFTGVHASLIAEIINSRSYLRVQFTCESYLPRVIPVKIDTAANPGRFVH